MYNVVALLSALLLLPRYFVLRPSALQISANRKLGSAMDDEQGKGWINQSTMDERGLELYTAMRKYAKDLSEVSEEEEDSEYKVMDSTKRKRRRRDRQLQVDAGENRPNINFGRCSDEDDEDDDEDNEDNDDDVNDEDNEDGEDDESKEQRDCNEDASSQASSLSSPMSDGVSTSSTKPVGRQIAIKRQVKLAVYRINILAEMIPYWDGRGHRNNSTRMLPHERLRDGGLVATNVDVARGDNLITNHRGLYKPAVLQRMVRQHATSQRPDGTGVGAEWSVTDYAGAEARIRLANVELGRLNKVRVKRDRSEGARVRARVRRREQASGRETV